MTLMDFFLLIVLGIKFFDIKDGEKIIFAMILNMFLFHLSFLQLKAWLPTCIYKHTCAYTWY